jgi:hypothetical protein
MTYAEIKNNTPTGLHKQFASQPPTKNGVSWLPITYQSKNISVDPIKERVGVSRTISQDGLSVIYNEYPITLGIEEVEKNAINKIKRERDNMLNVGFDFQGNNYQTRNLQDIINIMGVGIGGIMASVNSQPFTANFRNTDNEPIEMDATTTTLFLMTMLTKAQEVWNRYNVAYEAILAANTIHAKAGVKF